MEEPTLDLVLLRLGLSLQTTQAGLSSLEILAGGTGLGLKFRLLSFLLSADSQHWRSQRVNKELTEQHGRALVPWSQVVRQRRPTCGIWRCTSQF